MTVTVSFVRAAGAGVLGLNRVRVREDITIPGSTTATAEEGELVVIGNAETSMVAVA